MAKVIGCNIEIVTFQDPDDLPFRKNEILTVISKDEDHWWTARNSQGQTGSIPVPYVQRVCTFQDHTCSDGAIRIAELSCEESTPEFYFLENPYRKLSFLLARVKRISFCDVEETEFGVPKF